MPRVVNAQQVRVVRLLYRKDACELAAIFLLFCNFDIKLMTLNHLTLYDEAEKQAVNAAKIVVIDKLKRTVQISLPPHSYFSFLQSNTCDCQACWRSQRQVAHVSGQARVACLTSTRGVR
jgi:hypothetical protein